MHPSKKSSAEFDWAKEKLEEIRKSFIKHLEEHLKESSGLNEELLQLLTAENEPSERYLYNVKASYERDWKAACQRCGKKSVIPGEIISSSAPLKNETAESLLHIIWNCSR